MDIQCIEMGKWRNGRWFRLQLRKLAGFERRVGAVHASIAAMNAIAMPMNAIAMILYAKRKPLYYYFRYILKIFSELI